MGNDDILGIEGGGCVGHRDLVLAIVVAAVAVGCYWGTLSGEFVNWDDGKLILENPYVRGLTAGNLRHIWTSPIKETYLPLRATSYALDYEIWGYDPLGFHLTNIVLHAMVSVLVFAAAMALSRSRAAAVFAGLLFAVHPVHTEAVAWVSGRKDLLSTALFLASYLFYVRARRTGGVRWGFVAVSLVAFVLSGLAKAMVVTLPALVVLTDFVWGEGTGGGRWKRLLPVWAAYFATAGVITWIAMHFAGAAGAIRPWHFGGPWRTALFMTWVALFYVKTMVFPSFLSARHPYGDTADFGVAEWVVYASPFVLAAVAVFVLWLLWRARGREGGAGASGALKLSAFGLAWFFVTLSPVMNIIPINVLVADRYLYLPSVGFLLAAGALFRRLWEGRPRAGKAGGGRLVVGVLCALIVAAGAARTYGRNRVWRDSLSLWSSVVSEFPESAKARALLAAAYAEEIPPENEKAFAELVLAETLDKTDGEVHFARARLLRRLGRMEESYGEWALGFYKSAKKREQMGDRELAAGYYERALQARELLSHALEADPENETIQKTVKRVEKYTRGEK